MRDVEGEESEEVVMAFQGIVLRKELPPIHDKAL